MNINTLPEIKTTIADKEGVRHFDTGATRSAEGDKPDYEGFLSPFVIERFGQYMQKHRKQPDGSVRDSDNWQKGIPIKQYVKSLFRHFVSVWRIHRMLLRTGGSYDVSSPLMHEQEENLCAVLFNAGGMLHEILVRQIDEKEIQANHDAKLKEVIAHCERIRNSNATV